MRRSLFGIDRLAARNGHLAGSADQALRMTDIKEAAGGELANQPFLEFRLRVDDPDVEPLEQRPGRLRTEKNALEVDAQATVLLFFR